MDRATILKTPVLEEVVENIEQTQEQQPLMSKTPIIKRKRGRKKKVVDRLTNQQSSDQMILDESVEIPKTETKKKTIKKKKEKIRNKAMQTGGWGKIIMTRAKEIYNGGKNGKTWRESVAMAGKEFKNNKNKL